MSFGLRVYPNKNFSVVLVIFINVVYIIGKQGRRMIRKYTLSCMFDRGDVLRSCILNDNTALESQTSFDIEGLPPYIYERLALLKLTDDMTTVEHIGRRVGLGYYTIYLDVNEYKEVNKSIKQRKSANENTTETSGSPA